MAYTTGKNFVLTSSGSYTTGKNFVLSTTRTATGALVVSASGISGSAVMMLQAIGVLFDISSIIAGSAVKTVDAAGALQSSVPVIIGQTVIHGRQYAVGVLSSASSAVSGQLVKSIISGGTLVTDAALIAGIAREFSLAHVDWVLIAEQPRIILVAQAGAYALSEDAGIAALIENQSNNIQVEQ